MSRSGRYGSLVRLLVNAAFQTAARVGITRFLERLVPELSSRCELTVLTRDPEKFRDLCRVVPVDRHTGRHDFRVLWTLAFPPRLMTHRFDALLCATPAVPILPGIPSIAVVHDLTPLVCHRFFPFSEKFFFWLGLQSLRWARGAIAVSHNTKRDMELCGIMSPDRIAVVYEGPGIAGNRPERHFGRDLKPFVLYVGGHAPHKNVPRLIAAFARARLPAEVKLVLVGSRMPHTLQRSLTAATSMKVLGRVLVLKDLTDAELSGLYRNCDLMVYPSLYEGFGLPVLEAMAHGAPVICSRTSSIPEVGGGAVRYFDPRSVSEISLRIEEVLANRALAEEMSSRGPEQAECFSWARAAQQILEHVRSIARLSS